jgi:hypothetical protein
MLPASRKTLPVQTEVRLADAVPRCPADGYVDVRLRRKRGPGPSEEGWKAVVTVYPETLLDPDALLAQAYDFSVEDSEGAVGIVDDVRFAERTIIVASGWFGHHRQTLRFEDIEEIVPGERRLILRRRHPARGSAC